jgi:hypothetical protein
MEQSGAVDVEPSAAREAAVEEECILLVVPRVKESTDEQRKVLKGVHSEKRPQEEN